MRGTEVAQAYIDVGSDLSRFRRDLHTRGRRIAQDAGSRMGKDLNDNIRQELAKGSPFDELYDKNVIDSMERDFNRIVKNVRSGDWNDFWKEFNRDSRTARRRIIDVTNQMRDAGRVSDQERRAIILSARDYGRAFDERVKKNKQLKAATEEAKVAQDRYNNSLEGMAEKSRMKEHKRDVDRLVQAYRTGNFDNIWKNFNNDSRKSIRHIQELSSKMQKAGEMTARERVEVDRLSRSFRRKRDRMSLVASGFRVMGAAGNVAYGLMTKMWSNLDRQVRLVVGLVLSSAGQIASILSALGSTAVSVVSSVGMALGAIIPLAGTAVAAALGIGMLVGAMERMREQFPGINKGIDGIKSAWDGWLDSFSEQAGESIGNTLQAIAGQMERFDLGKPMGKALAGVSDAFTAAVESPGITAFLRTLRDRYPSAVEGFGAGFAKVFEAVGSLLAGAAPLADQLGRRFEQWATGLARVSEEARKSGAMKDVFKKVGDSVSAVWNLISSLGRAIGAVFMATSGHGNDLLNSFAGLIDRFTNWISTAEGQKRVNEWLQTGKELLPAIGNLLAGAGQAMARLVTPDTIRLAKDFLNTIGEWLPKLAEILETASHLDLLGNLANLLDTVTESVQPLIPDLTRLADLFGNNFKAAVEAVTPMLDGIVAAVKPVISNIADLAERIAPKVIDALGRISTSMEPVLEVFGRVVDFFQGILFPILEWLITGIIKGVVDAFEGFGRMIGGVVDVVTGLISGDFSQVWQGLKDIVLGAIQAVWGILQVWVLGKVVGIFRTIVTRVPQLMTSLWSGIRGLFSKGVSGILSLLGTWWGNLTAIFGGIAAGMWDWIVQAWDWITTTFNEAKVNVMLTVVELWNTLKENFTGGVEAAQAIISAWWERVKIIFSTAVEAVKSTIIGWWVSLTTSISGGMDSARATISAGWEWIKGVFTGAISAVISFVADWWSGLKSDFDGGMESASTAVSAGWDWIKSVFSGALDTIISTVTGWWENLKTGFSAGMDTISSFISAGWDWIKEIFSGALAAVVGFVVEKFENIKENVNTAMTFVQDLISTAWDFIVAAVSAYVTVMSETILNIWDGIKSGISTAMDFISNIISTVWEAIKSTVSTVVNAIRSVITTVFNAVKSFITTVFNGIKSFFSTVWNGIRNTVRTVVNAIRSTITSVFNAVRSTIQTVFNAVRSFITTVWNAIRSTISSVVNSIRSTIRSVFNAIRSVISSVMNTIRSVISSIWNSIRSVISSVVNGIRNTVSNAFNAVRNAISRVTNWVGSAVRSAFNNARTGVMNAVNGIRNSVTNGFNNVMNTVRRLPSRIWSALSKLWNDGISLGKNLIKGLINGIGSMAGTLWNAAQNIAKSAVNAIKGFFGIKSPSTVMRGFGHNIGEGLVLGLNDENRDVSNAMKSLSEQALGGMGTKDYVTAGVTAAEAFANGLSSVDPGTLAPEVGTAAGRVTRGYRATSPGAGGQQNITEGNRTIIEEGAINVSTPAQDGKIVAGQMLDELVKEL